MISMQRLAIWFALGFILTVTVYTPTFASTYLAGQIVGTGRSEVEMQTGYPHGNVYVFASPTTIIYYDGFAMRTGIHATATGSWNANGSFSASQIVLTGISPTFQHVLTFGYLGGDYGTHKVTWSQAAPYLSWAETTAADSIGIHAAGIKTIFYSDPNFVQTNDPLYHSPESAFAHDCLGHRTYYYEHSGAPLQYVMNPASSTLRSSFASLVVNPTMASGTFDALFEDTAAPLSMYALSLFHNQPCGYTDPAWLVGDAGMEGSLPIPVIFNGLSGLSPYGGYGISLSVGLFANATTIGGTFEHCYTQNSSSSNKYYDDHWRAVENTEIYVARLQRYFVCDPSDNFAPAGSSRQIDDRLYSYASFLLTYDPNTSILWDRYPTGPSGFPVNPESLLVAELPVIPTPTTITGLRLSTGVYGREYRACYVGGVLIGRCAAVVNPSYYTSHAFPYAGYRHTLVLSGSGLLDGGTILTNGLPPRATLPPMEAEIVFQ